MSHFSDDFDDMDAPGVRSGAGDTIGGFAGAGDDVTRFLTELRGLGDGPPPAPSAELAALLGGATPLMNRRVLVRAVLRSAAIAAILLGVLVVAAANHSLPAPAQRVVSNVVNVLTPFHIGGNQPQPLIEPPRPSDKPAPTHRPSPSHSATRTHPRATPPVVGGEDDGRNEGGGGSRSGDDGRGDDGGGDDSSRTRSSRESGSDDGAGSDDGHSSSPRSSPSPTQGGGDDGGRDDG